MRFSEKRLSETELPGLSPQTAEVVTIVVNAFAACNVAKSRTEASRLIKQGSVQLDGTKLRNIIVTNIKEEMPPVLRTLFTLAKEKKESAELGAKMRLKAASPAQIAGTLSGGNQQKVVIAKWLFRGRCGIELLSNRHLGFHTTDSVEAPAMCSNSRSIAPSRSRFP